MILSSPQDSCSLFPWRRRSGEPRPSGDLGRPQPRRPGVPLAIDVQCQCRTNSTAFFAAVYHAPMSGLDDRLWFYTDSLTDSADWCRKLGTPNPSRRLAKIYIPEFLLSGHSDLPLRELPAEMYVLHLQGSFRIWSTCRPDSGESCYCAMIACVPGDPAGQP